MKIGIAISGGGYRATIYSLGTFSYLNHLQLDNKPLLQHVVALSTVSGGSITGITYAQSAKKRERFDKYFKRMYTLLTSFDLVASSINNFVSPSTKNSLIEGFAKSYDDFLLDKGTFASIIPEYIGDSTTEYDSHLLFNCINATAFNSGLPFRFIAESKSGKHRFGNILIHHIDREKIKNIPLSIALAASSCFPGGFEPIDLSLKEYLKVDAPEDTIKSVSLMDGGIVDNQGADSLLLYHDKFPLDLALSIDVSSPSFTGYVESSEVNLPVIGELKMVTIKYLVNFFNILAILLLIYAFNIGNKWQIVGFTFFTTILTPLSVMLNIGKKVIANAANSNEVGIGKIMPMNDITPNALLQLAKNRLSSVSLLIGSVFMKSLRSKNTNDLFQQMKGNALASSIYSLKNKTDEDVKVRMQFLKLPEELGDPTQEIRDICEIAYKMKTTLWVPEGAAGQRLVQKVLVAGQLTTCASLLDYFDSKKQLDNSIYLQAKQDWAKFKADPYWLLQSSSIEIVK